MKLTILSLTLSILLVACNDNPPSTAPQGDSILSHGRIAQTFLDKINLDSNFDLELVKLNTEQDGFVLVYDKNSGTYEAIDVAGFDARNGDAVAYYESSSTFIYSDIEKIEEHYVTEYEEQIDYYLADGTAVYKTVAVEVFVPTVYRDTATGLEFEKTAGSSKDLAKITAMKEAVTIAREAELLSSEFGLSLNRGKEIANLKAHWKKASKKAMTASEVDAFSTELLGFSLSSGIKAYKASMDGDSSQIEDLIDDAAAVNGITPEHATKLMTKVFGL